MVTDVENIKKLAEDLEKQELDAPGGIPSSKYMPNFLLFTSTKMICVMQNIYGRGSHRT
ncbi:hypothetical protein C0J52_27336 [Blattella germanica]|nr:hypothetical protein C0J52_27336 [Blattella germanica]